MTRPTTDPIDSDNPDTWATYTTGSPADVVEASSGRAQPRAASPSFKIPPRPATKED